MPAKPNGPSQPGSSGHSPPDDDIRQQLEKILASPEFQKSPMMRDFLRFVVEKTLSGCAQEIKDYTMATEVMGGGRLMPQFFWDQLLRAAALGQLGRSQEAAQALTQLLAVKPDFPSQARFLIGCYAKSPYLVDGLIDGLRLAGLKI